MARRLQLETGEEGLRWGVGSGEETIDVGGERSDCERDGDSANKDECVRERDNVYPNTSHIESSFLAVRRRK